MLFGENTKEGDQRIICVINTCDSWLMQNSSDIMTITAPWLILITDTKEVSWSVTLSIFISFSPRQRWDLICIWLRFLLMQEKNLKVWHGLWGNTTACYGHLPQKLKYFSKGKIRSYHCELNFNNDNILNMKKRNEIELSYKSFCRE